MSTQGKSEELGVRSSSLPYERRVPSKSEELTQQVPGDLKDVDTRPQVEKPPAEVLKTIGPRPGDAEDTTTRTRSYGRVLFIIAVLIGVVIWLIGYVQRQGLFAVLRRAVPIPPPLTTLVDSRDGVVLMLEQSGGLSRVIVEKSDQANWLLVSKDDTTATNPALSSDGEQVAYVTKRGGGQLVIVSLSTDARRMITADQIRKAGEDAGLDDMELCLWTPIAWAPPAGDRIVFFGCVENSSFSVAVVGDLSDPATDLKVIAASKAESSDVRQLKWLDHTRLVISTPATDAKQAVVTTFVVP